MSKFYVAFSFTPAGQPQAGLFDYLIHPGTGEGGSLYCNAIVEAADRKSAWNQVSASFPSAQRNLIEKLTPDYLKQYDSTKRTGGVKTVKAKAG